jgi:hypothetical protein
VEDFSSNRQLLRVQVADRVLAAGDAHLAPDFPESHDFLPKLVFAIKVRLPLEHLDLPLKLSAILNGHTQDSVFN